MKIEITSGGKDDIPCARNTKIKINGKSITSGDIFVDEVFFHCDTGNNDVATWYIGFLNNRSIKFKLLKFIYKIKNMFRKSKIKR